MLYPVSTDVHELFSGRKERSSSHCKNVDTRRKKSKRIARYIKSIKLEIKYIFRVARKQAKFLFVSEIFGNLNLQDFSFVL